jgi:hypothetical protein
MVADSGDDDEFYFSCLETSWKGLASHSTFQLTYYCTLKAHDLCII